MIESVPACKFITYAEISDLQLVVKTTAEHKADSRRWKIPRL